MNAHWLNRLRHSLAAAIAATSLAAPTASWSQQREVRNTREQDTVSQHLGGVVGIYNFLAERAAPALLADPVVGPYFNGEEFTPTESAIQIAACLAMFLDRELGGNSPGSRSIVPDPNSPDPIHKCRGSMSKIHRVMKLEDDEFDRFIAIVAEQATLAGIEATDIQAVGAVLERRRGSIVHH